MLANQSIKDLTFSVLQKGPVSAVALIAGISRLRPHTTKQGVYRALRKLKKEEKVIIHGKSVSLNIQWLKKMSDFFSLAQFHYSSKTSGPDNFLTLGEKDRIIYFFKNLNLLDAVASHVMHILDAVVNPREPIFVYNPHELFAYAREESEEMLINAFSHNQRPILVTATHDDPLDRALKRRFNSDLLQYHISEKQIGDKNNYYFVILGGYLIEVFIDERLVREIDQFYKKAAVFDQSAKMELLAIFSQHGKNRLVISKKKTKIDRYKKLLSRHFFIKGSSAVSAVQ